MYKKSLVLIAVLFSLPAQAEMIEIPFEEAWDKAIEIILDQDGIPEFRDEELGVIRSDHFSMQLDKETADCGKMFGFAYIKDKRTKTSVQYSVRLKPIDELTTDVKVKVGVEGYFFKNETSWAVWTEKTRDADKVLQCTSTGVLEQRFIDQLKS